MCLLRVSRGTLPVVVTQGPRLIRVPTLLNIIHPYFKGQENSGQSYTDKQMLDPEEIHITPRLESTILPYAQETGEPEIFGKSLLLLTSAVLIVFFLTSP